MLYIIRTSSIATDTVYSSESIHICALKKKCVPSQFEFLRIGMYILDHLNHCTPPNLISFLWMIYINRKHKEHHLIFYWLCKYGMTIMHMSKITSRIQVVCHDP